LRIGSINPKKVFFKAGSILISPKVNYKRSYCKTKDGKDQNTIVDYVNTYGLGAEEGSSEWRDKKLELKVAGLFKQVIELSELPGAELHPKDVLIRQKAEEARTRITERLHDMRLKDPERFADIYSMLFSNFQGQIDDEKKAFSEGAVPGTLTPPWKGGGLVWKSFFDDHLEDILGEGGASDAQDQIIYEDGSSDFDNKIEQDQNTEEDPEYPWLPATDPNERLEQLEDPKQWVEQGKKKKKMCIFCSPERAQFPLEPMNVNLLLRFMNPSGFIKPRKKTGLCRTMQSRVARTIKHARNIGVFSYRKGVFTIEDPTRAVQTEYYARLKKERESLIYGSEQEGGEFDMISELDKEGDQKEAERE
jgi:ribosomal protein S18